MAFTKAAEVASLIQSYVLPGVLISIGEQAANGEGVEIVVRGSSHPEDGMSRVWHVLLAGQSSTMLDLSIIGLRKAGFELTGSSPLMKGTLTQVLTRAEVAGMRAAAREKEQQKRDILTKADIAAAASTAQSTSSELDVLRSEVERLKELVEDLQLMPSRGPRGLQGQPGAAGKDGSPSDLDEAELSDLGDVSREEPLDGMVLTWKEGEWKPWRAPLRSISQIHAAGGSGGDGGGIPEAPLDGLAYVRRNGQWELLGSAIQALVEGGNHTTGQTTAWESSHRDGGNFTTGDTEAMLPLIFDNGLDGGAITP